MKTDKEKIIVTLTDENGNLLANKKMIIAFNGRTYIRTTNFNGQIIIKYKYVWDFKVIAEFAGDDKYYASSGLASKRIVIKITLKKNGNKLTATLTDKNGKPLEDKKIVLRDSKGRILAIGLTDKIVSLLLSIKVLVFISKLPSTVMTYTEVLQ
ncbi:hypothetical protein ALNOE001_04070 [Candidatus Methanobinarius endosymbioticus]|uniref:Big-1 domain-containing protein n=1 Tax=Candidatus Methanobinarius endosymbioticus TaxID=2006182 RepID=A0A366MEQ9_9EURY|nr:hypothetical protein ALNOE001_04070 [Candidatus Methanobinarius endosymbioticus]